MSPTKRFSFDLDGRIALVTGASSGLGYNFAKVLAASGAKVVAGARRVELLSQLADEVHQAGGALLPFILDVSDESSVIAAYDAAEREFGPVDTVVANAGINLAGSAMGLKIDDFVRMTDVNLKGVFLTAREGAKRMVAADSAKRGHGRITLISSITAHQPSSGVATYCATKAAVVQLGRALAKDWAGKGINVNVLCPGYIETELNQHIWDQPGGKELLSAFPRERIMDRSALDPMLLYLSSDCSAQTTGSVFTIDDGQTL